MKLTCPHCQHTFSVTREYVEYADEALKCPKCKKPVEVPRLPASPIAAFILVGIISAALAGFIGFSCGALLTRVNREETEAKILAIKSEADRATKTAQQKSEELKKQISQLRSQLRESNSEIDSLSMSVREAWAVTEQVDNTTNAVTPASYQVSNVTFEEIDELFGRGSNYTELQKREFFEDYKFQRVQWTGEVVSVQEGLGGDLRVSFKHKQKTWTSDVTVSFPNRAKDSLLKLKEGQIVTYRGTIQDFEGLIRNHGLQDGEIVAVLK